MNYLIIGIAIVGIVLAIVFKIYNMSMLFPTLIIILALVLNVLSNTINTRKDKKIDEEIKNRVKK